MSSRIRHGLLISIAIISLLIASVVTSYAETITYEYDELNRLKQVTYEDGRVIQYIFDGAGNRTVLYDSETPPITTANPQGGLYSSISVTLTCTDMSGFGCDKIYYTTDGTTPTTSSSQYSSPINILVTTTLKFFSTDLASNSETVKTQIYTIDTTPPTTTASPGGGFYETSQAVTLTCSDGEGSGCDKIYYTTDGTTPTTSSPVYSSPINISVTTTLKFFSKDLVGNSETIKTETYYIGPESVSTPSSPNGPVNGNVGTSYTYSTGGAASNYGHSLEYLFDWGDGTNSGWLSVSQTSASHSWSSPGNYLVKAQARCSIHPSVVSNWSGTTSVSIILPSGNDSYTKSLLHMDGPDGSTTFTDNAVGGTHTWTRYGDAQIDTAQSKFGGASGLFDGSGDYLLTANHADFQVGSGNFTIDFWIRIPAAPSANAWIFWYGNDGNYYNSLYVFIGTDRKVRAALRDGSGASSITAITPLQLDTWHHVAFVRNGSDLYLFINGVSENPITTSRTVGIPDTNPVTEIGAMYGTTYRAGYLNGWLDEFRFSKGIARWTSNFTLPTEAYQSGPESVSTPSSPNGPVNGNVGTSYTYSTGGAASNYGHSLEYLFDWGDGTNSGWLSVSQTSASHSWSSQGDYLIKAQARCSIHPSVVSNWSGTTSVSIVLPSGNDSYTKSLLHMNGPDGSTTFTDNAAGGTHTWTRYGDAQIDTAQSKFGGASGLFDGSGDYLLTANHADFQVGSGNFTIDFWIRIPAAPSANAWIFWYGNDGNYYNSLYVFIGTDRKVRVALRDGSGASSITATTPLQLDTWHHVAFVRSGSDLYLFINGVSENPTTTSRTVGIPDTNPVTEIGAMYGTTYRAGYLNGWLDEFRFSKGIARWTSNFTPPSSEY